MKRLFALLFCALLCASVATPEPWMGTTITISSGTGKRFVTNHVLALSLSIQMATGGTGRGYVLYAPAAITCTKGGAGTTFIRELAPATASAPGGEVTISGLSGPEGAVDVANYCVDGSNSSDTVTVSWNLRN